MKPDYIKTLKTFPKEEYDSRKFDSYFLFVIIRSMFLGFIWLMVISSVTLGPLLLIPAIFMLIGYIRWKINHNRKFTDMNKEFLDMLGTELKKHLGYRPADSALLRLCRYKALRSEDYLMRLQPAEDKGMLELQVIKNEDLYLARKKKK